MKLKNSYIEKKIKEYGRDIISSDIFAKANRQTHHNTTTVGKHSLRVAWSTVKICEFLIRHGIKIDERSAVRAALMHDLGIIGRHEKFSNSYDTSRRHPKESLLIADKIEPQMSEGMRQAIERHMFPVFAKPPTRPEAIVVCIADKIGALGDLIAKNKK